MAVPDDAIGSGLTNARPKCKRRKGKGATGRALMDATVGSTHQLFNTKFYGRAITPPSESDSKAV